MFEKLKKNSHSGGEDVENSFNREAEYIISDELFTSIDPRDINAFARQQPEHREWPSSIMKCELKTNEISVREGNAHRVLEICEKPAIRRAITFENMLSKAVRQQMAELRSSPDVDRFCKEFRARLNRQSIDGVAPAKGV